MSTPEPAERDASAEPSQADGAGTAVAESGGAAATADPAEPGAHDGTAAAPEDPEDPEAAEAPDGDTSPVPERAGSWADFLPSPLFLLLLGVIGLAGWFSWTRAEQGWTEEGDTAYLPFVLIVAAWIGCLALQEYGRSVLAFRFGDRALRGSAYLRLNPFGYSELFAGVLMPVLFLVLGGFGMTGPALQIDRSSLRGRAAGSVVAVGGIVVHLVIAAALLLAVQWLVPRGSVTDNWAIAAMVFLCALNLTAAIISLLPVPGLAGFDVIAPYLPERVAGLARSAGLFGAIAVFAVLAFPQVNEQVLHLMAGLLDRVGLNQNYVGYGQTLLWPWEG